ncbi:MAG: hypothetical protein Q8Q59_03990 [Luteolibacter sp.]|nr:hypothetical protein [Luteolibacter sp.]
MAIQAIHQATQRGRISTSNAAIVLMVLEDGQPVSAMARKLKLTAGAVKTHFQPAPRAHENTAAFARPRHIFDRQSTLECSNGWQPTWKFHPCGFTWTRVDQPKSGTEVAQFTKNGIHQNAPLAS